MRKKGCFNENCAINRKQLKFKEEYNFCPICTTPLDYVCSDGKCYKPLQNVLKKLCDDCLALRDERKEKRKTQAVDIAKHSGSIFATVGTVVAAAVKIIPKKK